MIRYAYLKSLVSPHILLLGLTNNRDIRRARMMRSLGLKLDQRPVLNIEEIKEMWFNEVSGGVSRTLQLCLWCAVVFALKTEFG